MIELRTALKGDGAEQLASKIATALSAVNPDLELRRQRIRKLLLLSIVFQERTDIDTFRERSAWDKIEQNWSESLSANTDRNQGAKELT